MKKTILTIALSACSFLIGQAQTSTVADSLQADTTTLSHIAPLPSDTTKTAEMLHTSINHNIVPPAPQFGYVSYEQVLIDMIEYKDAMRQLTELRTKYEVEARYNETTFKRLFAEYLEGQKDFPQSIMLKRQRDLQSEMEKCLAFREDAEKQLKQAEQELLAPVKARLNNAIVLVGDKLKLDYIFNIDNNALPFANPQKVVDVTAFVKQHLQAPAVVQ